MPPKTKFNKDNIIDAAFEMAKKEGISAITARSVAKQLGCSVAPIYVNFTTIEELIKAVVIRVFAISDELLAKQEGADVFENIGRASLEFAKEYPELFRELVLQPNEYMTSYESVEESMVEVMASDENMRNWTLKERKKLFFKMRVFQLGLSTMVANGHLPSWLTDQEVEEILFEVGEELLSAQIIKMGEEK